ncbi:MAG: endonuclease [Nitrospirae bacterium]|nr:MAG: endonuclease [Nitrospirota bacterium]
MLTYNIQVGIGSCRYRHYLLHGWKHVMPHGQTLPNLDRIAEVIAPYDVVALQEVDSGSLRTRFVNQACYLAERAGFASWKSAVTRDLGLFAQHTNSLLSRVPPLRVESHRLPGAMEGRGVLEADFEVEGRRVTVLCTHLALNCRARLRQVRTLAERVNRCASAILVGDFNCQPGSPALRYLLEHTRLRAARWLPATYPSWRPTRRIDHILATEDLEIEELATAPAILSDHLPVAATVRPRAAVAAVA